VVRPGLLLRAGLALFKEVLIARGPVLSRGGDPGGKKGPSWERGASQVGDEKESWSHYAR